LKKPDQKLRDTSIKLVKERLASMREEDEPLIEAVRTLEFLDEAINVFSLHIQDFNLSKGPEDVGKQLNLSLDELKNSRVKIVEFLNHETGRLVPNLTQLAGPLIAARLIFAAGGICNLAKMPSSRIQVLGAKKSLFKHLKKATPPPKHGTILQHPLINTVPINKRGKIARIFAGKLAIAVRVDYYSKGTKREDLLAELNRQLVRLGEKVLTDDTRDRPKDFEFSL